MKKIGRFLLNILGVLLIILSVWVWYNWKYLQAFPSIISAYYAKEFCSCYFLIGHNKEYCHAYVKQYIPISDFTIDEQQKKVIVTGMGRKSTAIFENTKYGCVIR